MRIPAFNRPRPIDDEGTVLAVMAVCGVVGVLGTAVLATAELLALVRPLLYHLH